MKRREPLFEFSKQSGFGLQRGDMAFGLNFVLLPPEIA